MSVRLREIAASALGLFVVGYLLWPPGNVYWTAVADVIGRVLAMAVVLGVTVLVGVGIAALSDVSIVDLGVGGVLAYGFGMALIEATRSPISPVHFYLYAGLLVCVLVGAAVGERYVRSDGDVAGSPVRDG